MGNRDEWCRSPQRVRLGRGLTASSWPLASKVISGSTRQKPLQQPFLSLSLFNSDRRFDSLSYRSEIERLTPTQFDFRILDWEVPSFVMLRSLHSTESKFQTSSRACVREYGRTTTQQVCELFYDSLWPV
jgi:hypothetical protein